MFVYKYPEEIRSELGSNLLLLMVGPVNLPPYQYLLYPRDARFLKNPQHYKSGTIIKQSFLEKDAVYEPQEDQTKNIYYDIIGQSYLSNVLMNTIIYLLEQSLFKVLYGDGLTVRRSPFQLCFT